MRLLKPPWVSHDDKPIFSIDIHPDGSRFATGGQGDNAGKVSVWNMAPVRSEESEKNEKCPRLLCQMDNHLACVNSVRWSNNGRYLASGGDDKIVMIWQTSKYGGVSSVFGSAGKMVNLENWRCVNTLRGHHGDVLDVAFAPQDNWLASCSIDNTVIVWNMARLPEQVAVLKGHTSLVKGVTWDPVGKYLASQSDDKTLRVWRTLDWQQEACITEPFQECGGTTHVLRLGWSPDGHYVVSAHAMNNSGPTAQIIKRGDGWKTSIDFVGHRKAVTVVRFSNKIFTGKQKKSEPYTCCAIGSRDRSISIWLTSLKRPLVVMHDLFNDSIMDISWSPDGMSLLCCSWDGTVAFIGFDRSEIGKAMTNQQKIEMMQDIYGKSIMHGKQNNQIIESADLLNLQEQEEAELHKPDLNISRVSNGNSDSCSRSNMHSSQGTPVKMNGPQIETKTRDGRRRITPILLAVQPDVGDVPLPFNSSSNEPVFSSTKEKSSIPVEKSPHADGTATTTSTPVKSGADDKITSPVKIIEPKPAEKRKRSPSPVSDKNHADKSKSSKKLELPSHHETPPKKKDGRGRPRKDRTLIDQQPSTPTTAPIHPTYNTPHTAPVESKKVYSRSSIELPIPEIKSRLQLQISGSVGGVDGMILEVGNNALNTSGARLHSIKCCKGSDVVWENMLPAPVIAVAGNSNVSCAACKDCTINIFSTAAGVRLFAGLALDSQVSTLRCSGHYCMAITSYGTLYVWNIQTLTSVINSQSLSTIIHNSDVTIRSSLLTEQGLPVITLSTGASYTYKNDMASWVLLTSRDNSLQTCSDYKKCLNSQPPKWNGPLATLQASRNSRPGANSTAMLGGGGLLQRCTTISHIEHQLSCCTALQSVTEYKFWMNTYVRYLAQEAEENKIRALFDDLLGPLFKSKSQKWQPKIMGLDKRSLLRELLPLIATNLSLQRIYTEYHEQLQSIDQ